jgi:hypothetical protein
MAGALYLGPVAGHGTDQDPFRAPYDDMPGMGAILFGPARRPAVALVWLPDPVREARLLKLADHPFDRATVGGRRRFASQMGVTFSRNRTYADLIASLLLNHGRSDGRGWRGMREAPSRRRSAYEVWLGSLGRIWYRPIMLGPCSQRFTESWPTDGTSITTGQDLTWVITDSAVHVTSGVAHPSATATYCGGVSSSLLDTSNQRADVPYTAVEGGAFFEEAWVFLRATQTGVTNLSDFYLARIGRQSAGYDRRLRRYVGGVQTTLVNQSASGDPGSPGTIIAELDGASVALTTGGVRATATDASPSHLTARQFGFYVYSDTGTTDVTVDNLIFQDIHPRFLLTRF